MKRTTSWLMAALLLGLWLVPWLARLETPLVFGDDVLRLIDVQTLPLAHRLVRPFNEHFAPLFELWTEAVWTVCSGKMAAVPAVFTGASILPFLTIVPVVWWVLARAWSDKAAASLAATLLATTPVHAETVFWFSASSFVWALLFTVFALSGASKGGARGLAGAAFCSAVAPIWSGVGLLAGPAAAALIWAGRGGGLGNDGPDNDRLTWRVVLLRWTGSALSPNSDWGYVRYSYAGGRRRNCVLNRLAPLVPLVGTSAAVGLALLFRHQDAVARSAREYLDLVAGLAEIPGAVAYLIGVGYLGLGIRWEPSTWAGLAGLAALAWISAHAPRERRGWVAAGWVLLVGGYALTFGIRVHVLLGEALVRTTRYHLFPCLGLALILSGWIRPPVAAAAVRRRLAGVALAALALVLVNGGQRAERLRYYEFLGAQRPFLAALDRLAEEAGRRGIGREEVLAAIESSRPRWVHPDCNAMELLPRRPGRGAVIAGGVRETLLSALTADERAALGAQADLSDRLVPGKLPAMTALRVRAAGLRLAGTRLETAGAPAFVEYHAATGGNVLGLPGTLAGAEVEVWWRGEAAGEWRSAVVRVPVVPAARWDLPLENPSASIRIFRLVVRTPGTYELGDLSVGGEAVARSAGDGRVDR